jgi:sporulation protein YlmC with PRC-barrel domain
MKTSTLLVATLLGCAIATTQGQTQSSTTTSYVQTSKIVGMKIKDSSGQEVGVVKDVVLDRNTGCMAYTVLSTGGTGTRVTGAGKTVAVPWTVYTTTSDPSVMTVRVERDRVYNAPAFDYARIDEYSTSGYINNIYSYYGVTPGVGVGVGASTTTGTTTTGTYGAQTGVAGQATTAGSPGAAAFPAATAMASPTGTVTTSPAASPRATASPTATAKATATSTASRRATATPSSEAESTGERRSHRHGESSATASPATSSSDETTTEHATGKHRETTSEEGTSETGSSKKSKRSKTETSEESSPAEPSATP